MIYSLAIILTGCVDSLYWKRLNTVEEIIQNPHNIKNIVESSQFYCNEDSLLNDDLCNKIFTGKYYYYNEKYGYLVMGHYQNEKWLDTNKKMIHYIKLRSPIDTMTDCSFLFEEINGKWCLKYIVKY